MEEWNDGSHYFQYSNVPTFRRSKFSSIFRNESSDRSIVSPFPFGSEEAAWKLLHPPVIRDALTALSLPVTGFVGAGASGFVFFDMTFDHLNPP